MATTITPPAAYSSIRKSVLFGITWISNAVLEVTVNGYVKQLPGSADKVNVAQYYRGNFTVWPVLDVKSQFGAVAGVTIGRVVNASIQVDGIPSATVPLINAEVQPSVNRFMSGLRRRIIACGQVDELAVYTDTPSTIVCGSDYVHVVAGIYIITFKVPHNALPRFDIQLMSASGQTTDTISYELSDNVGVRLGWINAYGAIDYWNFNPRRKVSTKITKEKIYTEAGYTPASILSEQTTTLISQPLPEQQTEVVAHIFKADNVWQIEGAEAIPIDITSDNVVIYDIDALTAIQVEYRSKTR